MISSATANGQPLFDVRGLRKSFIFGKSAKVIEVLKGIDLTVLSGEMLAIEGASGAGKSTLLHILGALDRPTAGEIYFQGQDLLGRSEKDLAEIRNRCVGFVFQFHHLLPEFTALENTILPGLIQGMKSEEALQCGEKILVQLGLGDRLLHKPGELSGGEQQRVAVARALMMKPQAILADEPTGNLDSRTGEEVHNLLVQINREQGITIVVVTHNPALAVRMNRRVLLVDGKLHDHG